MAWGPQSSQKNLGAAKRLLAQRQTSNPVDAVMAEGAGSAPTNALSSSGLNQIPGLDLGGLLALAKAPGGVQGRASLSGGGAAPAGGGSWSGPRGAVPSHHGWAGMQPGAKEWSLRLLGAFPELRFSSGYRTPAQNAAANGAKNSGHMEGWKADFSGNSKLLHEAAAWAKKYGARTLLHDAGSGFHLDVSFKGLPF